MEDTFYDSSVTNTGDDDDVETLIPASHRSEAMKVHILLSH